MSKFEVLHRLQALMKKNHITVYKLSKLSNVPQSTINSCFQKNRNPNINTLEKLCDALGISLSEFFQEDEPE